MIRNKSRNKKNPLIGVWIIGAGGSVASAVVAGAGLLSRHLTGPVGLITEIQEFKGIGFVPFEDMVFGGHEVRRGSAKNSFARLVESAQINSRLLKNTGPYLETVRSNTRPGVTLGCGRGISGIMAAPAPLDSLSLAEIVRQLKKDIADFKKSNRLKQAIVLNLASTEPPPIDGPHTKSLNGFERVLRADRKDLVRASNLYAYAAFTAGCPYINFTPSSGASIPALLELAKQRGLPHAGCDGKTGETLVKTALAGMFKYRALEILSWQGYNILGNLDGKVLREPENQRSKITTKDAVLAQTLGYKPHTHTGIDYVPSLGEWKVAWDFIHFKGFLGTKMSMQFIWQGCDSMLAAPLVLDLIRLVDLARRRNQSGALGHLALFFKQPLGTDVSDLHRQWLLLESYLSANN